jgi:hypothetical protein
MSSGVTPESAPFAARYAQLSEPELLTLARDYDSLLDPAQAALRAEFAQRGLEPPLLDEEAVAIDKTLVTIRQYRDLSEAIVARSMLEAAGMEVFLQDENLVRLDWQVSNFIGGIRLKVPADAIAEATELLDQPIPASDEIPGQPDFEQPTCPNCHSTDVTFTGSDRRAAMLSTFTLGIPLPLGAESWLCNACGTRWQDTSEDGTSES